MKFDLSSYMSRRRGWVEEVLEKMFLDTPRHPSPLFQAMLYSLNAGGKRLRPILMMAAYEVFGKNGKEILPFACAMEMIHTYSLIHDDLPAMDNDDLRRGKPTCHRMFGDAMAILAGDGLLTEAFHVLSEEKGPWPATVRLALVLEFSEAAGPNGMVGGQAMDILSEHDKDVDLETVRFIHTRKTGAIIRASVRAGALLADADKPSLMALTRYGEKIGIAFQIVDDILDMEGDTEQLGKEAGADDRLEKATYPHVVGLDASRDQAGELIHAAIRALEPFEDRATPLREIARFILERNR